MGLMKPWEASVPKTPRKRDRKRCYTVWEISKYWRTGGKVVWLTDRQLTFARIKYPNKEFDEVLERDTLEECKKYLDQTID
jgi:uncharacterized protein (DUF2126 family)